MVSTIAIGLTRTREQFSGSLLSAPFGFFIGSVTLTILLLLAEKAQFNKFQLSPRTRVLSILGLDLLCWGILGKIVIQIELIDIATGFIFFIKWLKIQTHLWILSIAFYITAIAVAGIVAIKFQKPAYKLPTKKVQTT